MTDRPETVFAEAQDAKGRGDLAAFFRCFDRRDQVRMAVTALKGLVGDDSRMATALGGLRDTHALPSRVLDDAQSLLRELAASAQRIRQLSSEARSAASKEHAALVRRFEDALDELVRSTRDLPAFLADAESTYRKLHGGGFVSSTLFIGDRLEDVEIRGNQAWATRVGVTALGSRWTEDVGFARDHSGGWRIKLLAKRPR